MVDIVYFSDLQIMVDYTKKNPKNSCPFNKRFIGLSRMFFGFLLPLLLLPFGKGAVQQDLGISLKTVQKRDKKQPGKALNYL